jgi:hypothetical protein
MKGSRRFTRHLKANAKQSYLDPNSGCMQKTRSGVYPYWCLSALKKAVAKQGNPVRRSCSVYAGFFDGKVNLDT